MIALLLTAALATASPADSLYRDVRTHLAHGRAAEARQVLGRLEPDHPAMAELAWRLAHETGVPASIASTARTLCVAGDPTGRACADAELYARISDPTLVELRAPTDLPLSTSAPFPLTACQADDETTACIVDTGASQTVVSRALADRLGLDRTRASFPVGSASGQVTQAQLAVLPQLGAGGLEVRRLPVLVMDMPELDRIGISLIVSPQQAFRGLTARIDLGRRRLVLSKGPAPKAAGGVCVPYVLAGFDLAVQARIGDGPAAWFGLDTGMEGAYSVASSYVGAGRAAGHLEVAGTSARQVRRAAEAQPVRVGALELRPAGSFVVADAPIDRVLPLAGSLGNGLWANGAVTLDTVSRLVTIEPEAAPAAPLPERAEPRREKARRRTEHDGSTRRQEVRGGDA